MTSVGSGSNHLGLRDANRLNGGFKRRGESCDVEERREGGSFGRAGQSGVQTVTWRRVDGRKVAALGGGGREGID